MLVKAHASAVYGINATTITVEVNATQGIKYFLVGLPDNAVKESQHRIESALKTNGFKMPGQKLIINLAPADIRKEGSAYDLPIALGILAASGQMNGDKLKDYVIMGELSLDGGVQPIKGALPISIQAQKENFKGFILPEQNAREAAVVGNIQVYGVKNLSEVIRFFEGTEELAPVKVNIEEEFYNNYNRYDFDFADVRGQESVKRALEIAAAGGHNIIIV